MSRETVYPPLRFCGSATKTRCSFLTQGGGVSERVGVVLAFFEYLLFNLAIKPRFGFLGLSGWIPPADFSNSTNGLLELHPIVSSGREERHKGEWVGRDHRQPSVLLHLGWKMPRLTYKNGAKEWVQ
jgi:hypothetical protein